MSHCEFGLKKTLKTRWGIAKINDDGYYRITSKKEGNPLKLLHRLIYEEFYGVKLPREIHIHHIDNNKLNNCILNLEAIHESEHIKLHKPKNFSESAKINRSKSTNTSGYFRVTKKRDDSCKQGFVWVYQYYNSEKKERGYLSSVSLNKLKEKVLDNGLEWKEL